MNRTSDAARVRDSGSTPGLPSGYRERWNFTCQAPSWEVML